MRSMTLAGGLLLAMSTMAMASQVYTWVDEKGVTHFSENPPSDHPATSFRTTTPAPRMPQPTRLPPLDNKDPEQEAVERQVKRKIATQEAERKKYCESVRANLAHLQNNPRLLAEINGETHRLTEEERQARIAEAKKAIEKSCR